MARLYMTKDVTTTIIKCGKITINAEGQPEVKQLHDITIIGTTTPAKANKIVSKKYGMGASVYNTIEETKTYKMKVEDFIKVAEIVTDDDDTTLLDDDDEEQEEEPEPTKRGKIKIIPKEEVNS